MKEGEGSANEHTCMTQGHGQLRGGGQSGDWVEVGKGGGKNGDICNSVSNKNKGKKKK